MLPHDAFYGHPFDASKSEALMPSQSKAFEAPSEAPQLEAPEAGSSKLDASGAPL